METIYYSYCDARDDLDPVDQGLLYRTDINPIGKSCTRQCRVCGKLDLDAGMSKRSWKYLGRIGLPGDDLDAVPFGWVEFNRKYYTCCSNNCRDMLLTFPVLYEA